MADLTAAALGKIVAAYLTDRDDIASVGVTPTDDPTVSVSEIIGQGGARFLATIVRLSEGNDDAQATP